MSGFDAMTACIAGFLFAYRRCQLRLRMPYESGGKRLHFHCVRQEVRGERRLGPVVWTTCSPIADEPFGTDRGTLNDSAFCSQVVGERYRSCRSTLSWTARLIHYLQAGHVDWRF